MITARGDAGGGSDVQQVRVDVQPIAALETVLGPPRFQKFVERAAKAEEALAGRAVISVNSTATGGGVAEMLTTLLAYARGAGIDARWTVIEGDAHFFDITKRIHNRIYGNKGDEGKLGSAERKIYEHLLDEQVAELSQQIRAHDVMLLHDPQTLGLAPHLQRANIPIIWRCHIGADATNEWTEEGWAFLSPYLEHVDAVVVSRDSFAPPNFDGERVVVIPPSIDPLAVKNTPLNVTEVQSLLAYTGLLQGTVEQPAVFQRRDGTPARVDRQADVVQTGPPPPAEAPLVVQVSRWDRLKDMAGVMEAFAKFVDGIGEAHLMLAGPNVSGVSDDPEGAAVFEACCEEFRRLPHAERRRIHLACLPTADADENAAIVNALQRHATVVTQKSLAEGFGLTVVEAMWKARPVVASAVGGIVDQITEDSGVLVDDPHDLATFGAQVRDLLDDAGRAAALGAAAQERARDFLPDVHLTRWADLLTDLTRQS
jgi:trehalose synthase